MKALILKLIISGTLVTQASAQTSTYTPSYGGGGRVYTPGQGTTTITPTYGGGSRIYKPSR
jgi:hypothetical protein